MEIQKVFSNIEDPGENLYSVLMSEEELSLFSEVGEATMKYTVKRFSQRGSLEDIYKTILNL